MANHSQCTVTREMRDGKEYESHDCGLCPHGRVKGGAILLRGDPEIDGPQRRMKLKAIDRLRCEDDHPHLTVSAT